MLNITYTASGDIIATDSNGTSSLFNLGDIAWTLTSTALVWIMIPGLGFLYSGLLRRKNALSQMYMGLMVLAAVSFQWFFWGFSLAFSSTGGLFIGDLKHFAFMEVLDAPSIGSTRIPVIVYCIYQLMFAAITPMIAVGAFAERGHLGPIPIFVFAWSTLVYDPIACWTWSPNGWSAKTGVLDFAGGTPVHISSGAAALAISVYLGKRKGWGTEKLSYRPHNTSYVVLGTVMLWFGWFGFNGGSALSANLRAAQACIVTNLAASVGGLTWMIWDYRIEHKWSAVGFCSGAIAGLVAITPASGFVGAPAAVLFGVMAGTCCNFATQFKFLFAIDDALDIFASHAVCGLVGNILTGIFAQRSVAAYDGFTNINGGWVDQHYIQLGYQLADSVAGMVYSFVMTTIILWIMHYVPCCRIRMSDAEAETAEELGMDEYSMGEFAYDYIGLEEEALIRGGKEDFDSNSTAHESSGPRAAT
ncbi:ammonium transporter [Hymenopellis radicata]|nr:ammonium transporter [Hymenopellis radicata]